MMVEKILNQLKGTNEAEIILQMENAYSKIASEQNKWYEKSSFTCTSGCGECCDHFSSVHFFFLPEMVLKNPVFPRFFFSRIFSNRLRKRLPMS